MIRKGQRRVPGGHIYPEPAPEVAAGKAAAEVATAELATGELAIDAQSAPEAKRPCVRSLRQAAGGHTFEEHEELQQMRKLILLAGLLLPACAADPASISSVQDWDEFTSSLQEMGGSVERVGPTPIE